MQNPLGRRGRVLRVRPGHLANFSGGAGYMPFIIFFSVPASIVGHLVSTIVLAVAGRRAARRPSPEGDLSGFLRNARVHLLFCWILGGILGALFTAWAITLIYDPAPSLYVAAAVLGAGPFLAWVLSARLLVRLTAARGPRPGNVVLAVLLYLLVVLVAVLLVGFPFANS